MLVIATKENSNKQSGGLVPRANVIDELPRVTQVFDEKWMLMLEKPVSPPSNQAEYVRSHFVTQSDPCQVFRCVKMLPRIMDNYCEQHRAVWEWRGN